MGKPLIELREVPVTRLAGVGPAKAEGLAEMGIESVLDLLLHYPRRYVDRTNEGRAGFPGEYREAGPVDIRLGLLEIGDIRIGAVNAEVFNPIAQRLKRESPYARTMMATLTNGMARSGYIPHDAGFGMYTFEVLSSRLQPGCAESAIVDGLLELMSEGG